MDYGRLIRDAWQMTWRHPFLWLLGLFAGGTAGFSLGSGGGRGGGEGAGPPMPEGGGFPQAEAAAATFARWVSEHIWLIAVVAGLVMVLAVAGLILSLIAQGGMASATADFASGRQSTLGRAWRSGVRYFWRYAGLWLLLIAAAAAIGAIVAGFIALVVGLTTVAENAVWIVAPGLVVGLALVIAGIAAGVVASIVVPFAQRAIAVRNVGPLAALRDGWLVLREHPGASLLIWLLNLALTLGAGLVITLAMLAAVGMLALPAIVLWSAFALTAPTISYLVLAGAIVVGVLLTLVAIANTFFWSYWTLAYLRLGPGAPTEPSA